MNKRFLLIPFIFIIVILFSFLFFYSKSSEQIAKEIHAKCKELKDEICYTDEFVRVTRDHDIEFVLEVLFKLQLEKEFQNGCHFIGHVIANEEVAKDPTNWKKSFSKFPVDMCTGGFVMGIMEAHKKSNPSFVVSKDSINAICQEYAESHNNLATRKLCYHTMGHLMLVEKEGLINPSLLECEKLPQLYQFECSAGVFMENLFKRNLAIHHISKSESWNEKTLQKYTALCNMFSDMKSQACWKELSHILVELYKDDFKKVYGLCMSAPEKQSANECYLHAVGVMSLVSVTDNVRHEAFCSILDKGQYKKCKSAIGQVVDKNL